MSNFIDFTISDNSLVRPTISNDHWSMLWFKNIAPPSQYGQDKIKKTRSLKGAEALGIIQGDILYGVVNYHIKEYYRMNPSGVLFVGFDNITPSEMYMETNEGEIRQLAVYGLTADIEPLQDIANFFQTKHKPIVIGMGLDDVNNTIDINALPNLGVYQCPDVFVIAGGDHSSEGAQYADSLGKAYEPSIGAILGALSRSNVHESISWIGVFNFAGVELNGLRLCDGTQAGLDDDKIDELQEKRYIFLRKYSAKNGTNVNESFNAIDGGNSLNKIEKRRTLGKAIRSINEKLLPEKGRPLYLDPNTGEIKKGDIVFLENIAGQALKEMQVNGNISGYQVYINSDQDISDGILDVEFDIVLVESLQKIEANIKFSIKLNT